MFVSFGRSSLVSDVKIMNADGTATPRTLAADFFLSGWTPDSSSVVCYRDWKYALVSTEQANHGGPHPERSEPVPGELFFRSPVTLLRWLKIA